jgi:hypothetical protein
VEIEKNDFLCHFKKNEVATVGGNTGVVHGEMLKQSVEKPPNFAANFKFPTIKQDVL